MVDGDEDTPLPVRRRCPLFEASMGSASSTGSDLRCGVRESNVSVCRPLLPVVGVVPKSSDVRCKWTGANFSQQVGTVRAFEIQRWSLRPTLRRRRRVSWRWTPDLCWCCGGLCGCACVYARTRVMVGCGRAIIVSAGTFDRAIHVASRQRISPTIRYMLLSAGQ